MKFNKLVLAAIAGPLFFASCSSDDDSGSGPTGAYDNGVLILNEGGFNAGNASVSFLSNGFVLENNIYASVNPGMSLGDTGQDIGLKGNLAYIVVNNSHKVEIVNRYTFEHVASITTGLNNPRYITFSGNKAFVTNWGDGTNPSDDFVAVIDLATNAVTASIPVAEGPEKVIEDNDKIYVAHRGGYGYGNTVTVINAQNNSVTATLPVGDVPISLAIENGKLYVLSEGRPSWSGFETAGKLHLININNTAAVTSMDFSEGTHPSNLVIEGGQLYYTIDSEIYRMDVAATALPQTPLFTAAAQGVNTIYSFAVNDGHIFVGDPADYNSNGKVYVYSAQGALHHTFTVGVIPAGFYFND